MRGQCGALLRPSAAGADYPAISRYQDQETWPQHPALAEPEYQGLQEILIGAGLVRERQPYEKVVRPEFAEAVGS